MPHKKKTRLFTRHNSTKFVLYTEGRDVDGNKITENVLVPVSQNHVPGSSLLISHIAELCGQGKIEDVNIEKDDTKQTKTKVKSKCIGGKEPNLENILDQMEDTSDDEEEEDEFKNIHTKMRNMNIFDDMKSSEPSHSNVHVEIIEESDFSDEFGQFSDADFDDIETNNFQPYYKSASSKVDCPESLKILNEGFEKVLEEYDDDQIGALDDEEICGAFSTENEQMINFINTPLEKPKDIEIGDCDEDLKEKILAYAETAKPEKIVEIFIPKPLEFDCESILSTYSNIYNHPVIIKEESKIRKITIPNNPLQKNLTKSKLKKLDPVTESDEESDKMSVVTNCNFRGKDETPEQKRERKNLFKELKRERRLLKKENKLAFKQETIRQQSEKINARNNAGIILS